jgi:hypothetical protein
MGLYSVTLRCPKCEQVHRVINGLVLHGGPTERGTATELYAGRELPTTLVDFLTGLVKCDETGEWVEMDDPVRVYLRPRRQP